MKWNEYRCFVKIFTIFHLYSSGIIKDNEFSEISLEVSQMPSLSLPWRKVDITYQINIISFLKLILNLYIGYLQYKKFKTHHTRFYCAYFYTRFHSVLTFKISLVKHISTCNSIQQYCPIVISCILRMCQHNINKYQSSYRDNKHWNPCRLLMRGNYSATIIGDPYAIINNKTDIH